MPTINKIDICIDRTELARQKKLADLKQQKEHLNRLTKSKRK
jgi:hypothetical protein